MMDRYKWMIVVLLIMSDPTRRLWKREDEIWLSMNEVIVNNDRISSVNRSAIMRIVNVTLDDEGYYTCTAFTRSDAHKRTLHLQVKEAPHKLLHSDDESDTDRDHRSKNTIRYYCNMGQPPAAQSNWTSTGSPDKTPVKRMPEKTSSEPEYIKLIMKRLNDIEDKMAAIEQRITTVEDNTSEMRDKISAIDNRVLLATDKFSINYESRTSSVIVTNISSLGSFYRPMSQLLKVTKAIDEDTAFKCMTMQLGVRNGHSVFIYTWVVDDFNKKYPKSGLVNYFSPAFYHTIPGYKFRLKATIFSDKDVYIYLSLLPGPYDDQLSWPFSTKHDLTLLTNNGTEVLQRSFTGQKSTCQLNRPTSATRFSCYTLDPDWNGVWKNRKHILNDGSIVAKLYLYD